MPINYGKTVVSPPAKNANNQTVIQSMDEFGATQIRREERIWAEQGSYFKACNATFGTGIAQGIQTSFSDTQNLLLIMRNGSASKKIIPHYIRLICTATGSSTTAANLAIILDTVSRYSSGGTDLTGNIVNSNSAQSPTSVVDVLRFGAVTAASPTAKRQIARIALKNQASPCWVVGDEILIKFGEGMLAGGSLSGAAAGRIIAPLGDVILEGQNHSFLLHLWNTANATTPPSWEIETAWWER